MIAEAVASLLSWRPMNASFENPAMSISDPAGWESVRGGSQSEAGISVNHRTALGLGVVWQCVSTLSGDVAISTMNVFKTVAGDDREIDWKHEAQPLVAVQPNEEMCAFEFWRRVMTHLALWQDSYVFVHRQNRSPNGKLLGLYNLLPDRTTPVRLDDGTLVYATEIGGQLEPLRADEVLHFKGLSIDRERSCNLVEYAKNAIGLALAAEGFTSKFFKNGSQAGGVLEIPATFTEKAKQVLEEGFEKKFSGKDNWFRLVILRDGAKFHATTVDAQKSQTHELREDQVRDLARFFNMPPSKVGLSDSVSYNSQEQSQIAYLTGCLNHWFGTIRGECGIKLLSRDERMTGARYFEHNVTKLLEVDTKTMNEVLAIQRQNEIVNADEWRRKIGLNKRPDGKGGEYVNPNTKSNAGSGQSESDPKEQQQKQRKNAAIRDLFCETVNRVARRVCFDARNEAKKPVKFAAWLDGKAAEHRDVFADALRPVLRVIDPNDDSRTVAMDGMFFGSLMDRLNPLMLPPYAANDLAANVDAACAEFEKAIAEKLCEPLKGILSCDEN